MRMWPTHSVTLAGTDTLLLVHLAITIALRMVKQAFLQSNSAEEYARFECGVIDGEHKPLDS